MRKRRAVLFIACGLFGATALASASAGPTCGTLTAGLLSQSATVCAATPPGNPFEVRDCFDARKPLTNQCLCKAPQSTPGFTGTGSSCAQADARVFSQGDAWIYGSPRCVNTDGICYESNVIVSIPCFFNSSTGLYQETGHLVFKCLFCN
jgi:hypothetical protein